jgi:zinc protease
MSTITFEKYTLSNGLDVILHQDRALPLVAVNVWYHVGSKNEELGKTGFAHLFEHVMFEGSKHHNRSHFEPLQLVGANLNGSTSTDRTNYWENVPSNYLELALWLEADRMGFLLEALDQRKFDVQRDVVKNERRQSYENRPYGVAGLQLQAAVYPWPHPYHWPTIGSQEDLEAATLDDVKKFFQRFYGPSNASLAIAGDFDFSEARRLVERYFGDLEPSAAVPKAQRQDSSLQGHVGLTLYDRVLLPRVFLVWPTVPRFDRDEAALSILGAILGDGRSSRLHRELVYKRQIAQSVGADHDGSEIAGDFSLDLTAAADHSAEEIEYAARKELERICQEPPTLQEIVRAQNRFESRRVRQLANIGGFGGRANQLNAFNVLTGDPNLLNEDLERYMEVGPEDVQRVAQTYLGDRHAQLVVLPEPSYKPGAPTNVDRSVQPTGGSPRPFEPPLVQHEQLTNGIEVRVVEKRGLPIVAFGVTMKGGAASDPKLLPGLTSLTNSLLQEGTTNRTSEKIADDFEFIGSQIQHIISRERVGLATETLTRHWPEALALIADLLQHPTFPDEEVKRIKEQRLTALRRLRDDPSALADRVGPALLYGLDSPYGHPSSGTESVMKDFSRQAIQEHFQTYYGPKNASLVVVGDISIKEVLSLAERHLGGWANKSPDTVKTTPYKFPEPEPTTIYLLDKPSAAQSVIQVGHLGVPRLHPDYYALSILNHLFGGQFTARLNMNLRQDKGYSYGYRSGIGWYTNSSFLLAGGSVQTAVTKEAIKETLKEFTDIQKDRLVTEAEFDASKENLLRQFPAGFETVGQILDQLLQIAAFDLPDNYYRTLTENIQSVSLSDVRQVAKEHLRSEHLMVLVVGDKNEVKAGLEELGYPLRVVDPEGRLL